MVVAESKAFHLTGFKSVRIAFAALAATFLVGCQDEGGLNHGRAYRPIPEKTLALMDQIGTTKFSPVLLRAFKKESELEVWKAKADGTYALLKTYPMCRWSGQLGPKRREGDRQVPEGFYFITPRHMNPNSAFYLSFNVGYPNAYDKAYGRTGSHIMVHGACSSRGCFSMTDEQIAEIYAIVREAFSGGQKSVQLQSLPFRMTPENLAKHRLDKNIAFWKKLKEGADYFDVSKREPSVMVCNRQYVFNAKPKDASARVSNTGVCPPVQRDETLLAAVTKKQTSDQVKIASLIKNGLRPVKIVYKDGGQHPSFAHVTRVSRPEALAYGPVEIALDDRGRPLRSKPATAKSQLANVGKDIASETQGKTSVAASRSGRVPEGTKVARTKTPSTPEKATLPDKATAFAATPANEAGAKSKESMVKRWFGTLGVFGTSGRSSQDGSTKPADQGQNVGATSGKKPGSDKRAALPALIRGAHRPLPAGLTAYAPIGNQIAE